jgi:hypothetical protein
MKELIKQLEPCQNPICPSDHYDCFECAIKAFWTYLMGKCTDHPIEGESQPKKYSPNKFVAVYPEHRHDCPACMKELEEIMLAGKNKPFIGTLVFIPDDIIYTEVPHRKAVLQ